MVFQRSIFCSTARRLPTLKKVQPFFSARFVFHKEICQCWTRVMFERSPRELCRQCIGQQYWSTSVPSPVDKRTERRQTITPPCKNKALNVIFFSSSYHGKFPNHAKKKKTDENILHLTTPRKDHDPEQGIAVTVTGNSCSRILVTVVNFCALVVVGSISFFLQSWMVILVYLIAFGRVLLGCYRRFQKGFPFSWRLN